MESNAKIIVDAAVDAARSKKAEDIRIMDMSNVSGFADAFVICHATSDVQVRAISNEIIDSLLKQGIKAWHREGLQHLHWVLLDYVNVVVHVFRKEAREFYNLERLWGDADIEIVSDEVT
ncbi:ribosome silencing factor [bacterium]|nr:ribosome silencing factor [bacterium]